MDASFGSGAQETEPALRPRSHKGGRFLHLDPSQQNAELRQSKVAMEQLLREVSSVQRNAGTRGRAPTRGAWEESGRGNGEQRTTPTHASGASTPRQRSPYTLRDLSILASIDRKISEGLGDSPHAPPRRAYSTPRSHAGAGRSTPYSSRPSTPTLAARIRREHEQEIASLAHSHQMEEMKRGLEREAQEKVKRVKQEYEEDFLKWKQSAMDDLRRVRRELEQSEEEKQQTLTKLHLCKRDLENVRSEVSELQLALDSEQRIASKAKETLRRHLCDLQEKDEHIAALEHQIKDLTEKLICADEDRIELRESLAEAVQHIRLKMVEFDRLSQQLRVYKQAQKEATNGEGVAADGSEVTQAELYQVKLTGLSNEVQRLREELRRSEAINQKLASQCAAGDLTPPKGFPAARGNEHSPDYIEIVKERDLLRSRVDRLEQRLLQLNTASEELETMKGLYQRMVEEREQHISEYEELQDVCTNLEMEKGVLVSKLSCTAGAGEALEEMRIAFEAEQDKCAGLLDQIEMLQQQQSPTPAEDATAYVDALRAEKEELAAALAKATRDAEEKEYEIAKLQEMLRKQGHEADDTIAELEREKEDLKREVSRVQKLAADSQTGTSDVLSELQRGKEALAEEAAQLRAALTQATRRAEELEDAMEVEKAALESKAMDATKTADAAQRRLVELLEEKECLMQQVSDAKAAVASEHSDKDAALRAELESLRQEKTALSSEAARLREAGAAAQSELEELRRETNELTKRLAQAEAAFAEKEAELDEAKQSGRKEKAAAEQLVEDLRAEAAALKNSLASAGDAKGEVDTLRNGLERAKAELAAREEEFAEIRMKLSDDKSRLEAELAALEKDKDELQKQLLDDQEKLSGMTAELKEKEATLGTFQEEKAFCMAKISELEGRLAQSAPTAAGEDAEVVSLLQTRLTAELEEKAATLSNVKHLAVKFKSALEEVALLQERVKGRDGEVKSLSSELEEKGKEVSAHLKAVSEWKQKCFQCQKELEDYKSRLAGNSEVDKEEQHKKRVKDLKDQLMQANRKNRELEDEVKVLRRKAA